MTGPVLSLRGVSKSFSQGGLLDRLRRRDNRLVALHGVSLDVMRGDVVGIVGESGSGKSTLAGLAVGLAQPTSGEVLLDGQSITELMRDHAGPWRRRVQMVFQDSSSALNPRKSVARCLGETLALHGVPKPQRESEIVDLLTLVGLGREIGPRLPHELSGGQRQRIGLARALYREPSVLILDEATSALDGVTEEEVMEAIAGMRDQVTMIIVAHRLTTVRDCDRIYLLDGGRVTDQGTYGELIASNHLFRGMAKAAS
jgi:ABC-type glutathione transport system ATPase component